MKKLIEQNVNYLESEVIGVICRKINRINNRSDLKYVFSFNVSQNLNLVLEPGINIYAEDLSFSPEKKKHYILSDRLLNSEIFFQIWNETRLSYFVQIIADSAYNRYVHLTK